MSTETAAQAHQLPEQQEPIDDFFTVSCRISDPQGAGYNASINLAPGEPLSNVSAALLQAAQGVTATHGPVLAALFRDLIETGRALANATPGSAGHLAPGIRVADVDQVLQHHRGADQPARLVIPGLDQPVPADVVRAILVAAGAF
jgi:hypothetical protein